MRGSNTEIIHAITNQPWPDLGSGATTQMCAAPKTATAIIQQLYLMLLARVTSLISFRDPAKEWLARASDMDFGEDGNVNDVVPATVRQQMLEYVTSITMKYREVYYHSKEHAYHVVVSANKLLDMLLDRPKLSFGPKSTFGIRGNPLLQMAFIYAALIHDCDHQGVSNGQLVQEENDLATLYNDQSVAENQSLAVAFRTLNQKRFAELKVALFPNPTDYSFFRRTVIKMVMCTDIASPERMQIVKSKWKEAFGHPPEQQEGSLTIMESTRLDQHIEECYSLSPSDSISADAKLEDDESTGDEHPPVSRVGGVSFRSDTFLRLSSMSHDATHAKNHSELDENDTADDEDADLRSQFKRASTFSGVRAEDCVRRSISSIASTATPFRRASRRLSVPIIGSTNSPRPHDFRLGIRRAMDLSGMNIIAYPGLEKNSGCNKDDPDSCFFDDEVDNLKAAVVLETMLHAADVSANMQSWDRLKLWSSRLYFELKHAYEHDRNAIDPAENWFENQTSFLDSYVSPLARRLNDTGVFGNEGQQFLSFVEENRRLWLEEGEDFTEWLHRRWDKIRNDNK